MIEEIINKIKNFKNIAILGFGKEGLSTYNFIRNHDKDLKLTILDAREITLDDKNAIYKKYDGDYKSLEEYDLIIKTPGIAMLKCPEEIRKKITSQMELLLEFNRENVIGVTGTKGKSTTSTLIYNVFKKQKDNVFLVGNIGIPVFDKIEEFDDSIIVAEMSSHQLEFVDCSPHVGIVLNLYEDHLDHVDSLEDYHKAKMNIISYQEEGDYAIYDLDNKYLKMQDFNNIKSILLTVSTKNEASIYLNQNKIYLTNKFLIAKDDIKTTLKGEHNIKNIMFTLLVASLYKLDLEKTLDTISEFKGLEHRMEYVGKYKDINFYNDVIATIPEATINACKALNNVDTLIFGGMDRGINYDNFVEYLKDSNIKNFICMPKTGYMIGKLLDKDKVHKAKTLEEAVDLAFKLTKKEGICLLSPAAASYEYFKNFEEKGNRFKELIRGEEYENN